VRNCSNTKRKQLQKLQMESLRMKRMKVTQEIRADVEGKISVKIEVE